MKTNGSLLAKFLLIALMSFSFAKKGTCGANDYFRSRITGDWTTGNTWEFSVNGTTGWTTSAAAPNQNAKEVRIRNGHTVTMITLITHRSSNLIIDNGGTLIHQGFAALTLSAGTFLGGAGPNFTINGLYILNGTQPTFTGVATASFLRVNSNGIVRVDSHIPLLSLGENDDFAYGNTRVFFGDGAIFQWNTATRFDAVNRQYFVNSPIGTSPIFRVSQSLTGLNYIGNTPGNDAVQFNGRFEADAGITVDFGGNGPKVFRDGIGGAGTVAHKRALFLIYGNCGLFQIGISGATATIYGTVTINIEGISATTDMEVLAGATATITGSPNINIGDATLPNGTLVVSGTLINNSSNPVNLSYGNLNITNTVGGSGTFTVSGTRTVVTVAKTTTGSAGSLRFTPGSNTVYDFVMGLATPLSSATSRIELGNSLNIAHNLTLTRGIIVTGTNLLTWNNSGGTLTSPTGASYANSFIATCNADGSGLNYSIASPYDGSVGFRINNVGGGINRFFPVGATYLSAGTNYAASPNRIMINNTGTSDYFTVVVKKELMLYTPLSGVNRVWYVKEGVAGGSNTTVNLYFTKKQWFGSGNTYPSEQDEVETGFLYNDPHVVQQTNTYEFVSNSAVADVINYGATAYGTEIFAQYRNGVSADLSGNFNGIKEFSRFSVFNAANIILPVSITNLKAYQKGNEIQVEWQALNELNVDRYEIEKSADAVNFSKIAAVTARNNGNAANTYIAADVKPNQGKNFYRIKAIDRDGKITFTQIVAVDISNGRRYISIIPNPVRNRSINLQINNLNAGKYNIILYSIEGKAVYRTLTEHGGGSATQQIALPANVAGGSYILKVFNERENYTERIIVQ